MADRTEHRSIAGPVVVVIVLLCAYVSGYVWYRQTHTTTRHDGQSATGCVETAVTYYDSSVFTETARYYSFYPLMKADTLLTGRHVIDLRNAPVDMCPCIRDMCIGNF